MRRAVLPVFACFVICFADVDTAFPKGGRGRGGGGGNGGGRSAQGGSRGGRPTTRPQNGGGNRPTIDRQNRGGGNRPTIDPQSRGGGNRPSTSGRPDHAGGNRPTIDRQNGGGANRPESPGRPDDASGPTARDGRGRPQGTGDTTQTDPIQSTERLRGRDHALEVQRQNEERKLAHRQQIADHLRANADRNGNENLYDTADRMDQRALEHYERRMSRINGEVPDDGFSDGFGDDLGDAFNDDVTDLGDDLVDNVGDGLTDDLTDFTDGGDLLQSAGDDLLDSGDLGDALNDNVDSFARRLANEDRKLQHQLDIADHLRSISERNGNENLLETAQRMEDMAYTRYDRQLQKFFSPDTLLDPVTTDPLGTDPLLSDPAVTDTLLETLDVLTTP